MGWLIDCVACGTKVDVPLDASRLDDVTCAACAEIRAKAPEIFAWIVRVLKERFEGHVSEYRHDHFDND